MCYVQCGNWYSARVLRLRVFSVHCSDIRVQCEKMLRVSTRFISLSVQCEQYNCTVTCSYRSDYRHRSSKTLATVKLIHSQKSHRTRGQSENVISHAPPLNVGRCRVSPSECGVTVINQSDDCELGRSSVLLRDTGNTCHGSQGECSAYSSEPSLSTGRTDS